MELLGKIFGSKHRVKIMRLFLFNENIPFDIKTVTLRSLVNTSDARKELNMLAKVGFLKKKSFLLKVQKPLRKKDTKPLYKMVKNQGWILDKKFKLISALQTLLLDSELINEKDMITRIKKSGTIKLLVLSGLFIEDSNRKLDILIVGNRMKKDILEKEISIIESEIGQELRYAFFDQEEFNYRMSMYDKLLRDVLENDHKKLIDTLEK
jgi:hypothetical protein